ncbi:MAG: hypothetical protein IAX21_00620 [Candidatus Bathyarchaeota archaeon]|nr:MAG: hypothetical protein IAX21_00620 [Candidatus Bathyarchaeota archaeon]
MRIIWRRGKEGPCFSKPSVFFTLGQINSGKSTLLEHIGIKHFEKGATVLDVFASVDGENLAWLRSDLVKNKEVLLLRGDNVDVQTEHDCKLVENLSLKDLERYDFIISSRPLFLNRDHEYYGIGQLINLLYKRLYWRKLVCMIAREASSLWYSRVKVSDSQTDMKAEALYMFREMRHLGVSLALDSLRLQGIDIDLRTHTDYLFIKSQGIDGLPENLRFLYSFYDPTFLRAMKPNQFALVCRRGSLGVGHFPFHSWHKVERENIVAKVGLKIEYGVELEAGKDKGDFKTVGDKEHMKIISLYAEGKSYAVIRDTLSRSTKTISDHMHKHNGSVRRSGFCSDCRRGGGEFSEKVITKGMKSL